MASRLMSDLHPSVRARAIAMLQQLEIKKIIVLIYCTLRSRQEQAAHYAQSRQELVIVNRLRRQVGMAPITNEENSIPATWARPGLSWHEYGLALDMVPVVCGKLIWTKTDPLWKKLGAIGVSCGLEWAGNWRAPKTETPHFQYTGKFTKEDLEKGNPIPTDL